MPGLFCSGSIMSSTVVRPASRPLNFWVCLGVPAIAAITLVLLELTSLDMDLARLFYDPTAGEFIGKHSYFLENILHDRAKQVVIAFSVLPSSVSLARSSWPDSSRSNGSWVAWCCPLVWRPRLSPR
jgi:membrane-associated PAP2 superfamily phosphatase